LKKRDSWEGYGRVLPVREDLSPEAEESPVLEAFTRKRLVRTQQTGKYLSCGGVTVKM
jgi:hypothetical protein